MRHAHACKLVYAHTMVWTTGRHDTRHGKERQREEEEEERERVTASATRNDKRNAHSSSHAHTPVYQT